MFNLILLLIVLLVASTSEAQIIHGGRGSGGSGVASSITGSDTLPATCTVGQVYFDTDEVAGQQLYACSETDVWTLPYEATAITWAELLASGSAATSEGAPVSIRGTGGHTTTGWDIFTRTDGTPVIAPVCAGVRDACDKGSTIASTFKFFVADASDDRMLDFEPNAVTSNAQYALGTLKAKTMIQPPLNPRGAATGGYESIVTNQPNEYYITVTDANTDAVDFSFLVSTKMAGATTATFRLVGVSKNASPSGNIDFDCAMSRFTPGSTTYTAHVTTGEVTALLTPATQNRPVAVTTAAHTINGGALVAGDVVKGSCEVDAGATTSAQMSDFRLEGVIGITLDINSLSE